MPFWSDETWRRLNDGDAPVEPFDKQYLKSAKYIMAVGEEVYLSTSAQATIKPLSLKESFSISPGQFAYILTQETVRMRPDTIGFISMDADIKFSGLVNISGFHVDPCYHGRIIFSVFNAGPTTIVIRRGDRIFPLWIATLDQPIGNTNPKLGYDQIPSKLITAISGNKYTTAFELDEVVRKLRSDLDEIKNEVGSLKITKIQALGMFVLVSLLFQGIISDQAKILYNWVSTHQTLVQAGSSTLSSSASSTSQGASQQAP